MSTYADVKLFIDGVWRQSADNRSLPVEDPATEEVIGHVACAARADLDAALAAADRGFRLWRATSPTERSDILRRAAVLLRERAESIAWLMTREQGKPLSLARMETLFAAEITEWFAEEARRLYGSIIPSRIPHVSQMAVRMPVGPVAAFAPWNFPVNQVVRKLAAALAAGCSIIVKGPEETPASPAELVRAFADAGVPDGVINLVYGDPSTISKYLIPHPVIRKISFTGSTAVGKRLAALAGSHMKRVTMELGGHAPVLVFDDADVDFAISEMAIAKYRNAGQVCVAPTRFLVQHAVADRFLTGFARAASALPVGNGLDEGVEMGPLVSRRRLDAVEELVVDAVEHGARLVAGGRRIGNKGHYFMPTVLADVPPDARIMNEEPFGPVAIVNRFGTCEEAIAEANRLSYGLSAYAFTASLETAHLLQREVEAGMLNINHKGLSQPETPFGGIKDSGYGTEGGPEAILGYVETRFVSQMNRVRG